MWHNEPLARGILIHGRQARIPDVPLDITAQLITIGRIELPGNNCISPHRSTPLI
jgi:hypothetical protein